MFRDLQVSKDISLAPPFAQGSGENYDDDVAGLFIGQARLDAWSSENRISLESDIMTLLGDGRAFKLRPAVRFIKLSGPGVDVHGLVGKVKTNSAVITVLGGEIYLESVVLGEVAYDVQSGFLGEPIGQ